jgi:hypothetical protein
LKGATVGRKAPRPAERHHQEDAQSPGAHHRQEERASTQTVRAGTAPCNYWVRTTIRVNETTWQPPATGAWGGRRTADLRRPCGLLLRANLDLKGGVLTDMAKVARSTRGGCRVRLAGVSGLGLGDALARLSQTQAHSPQLPEPVWLVAWCHWQPPSAARFLPQRMGVHDDPDGMMTRSGGTALRSACV